MPTPDQYATFCFNQTGEALRPQILFTWKTAEPRPTLFAMPLCGLLPKAAPNDLVFIYIASHGSPDPFEPQKLYFLMNDTKVANMPKTGLGMFELQELLDHIVRAQRVVVFIDACHSAGVAGTKLVTGRQLERLENNVFNLYASKLYRETGRAILTSSDVNEISEEGANWGGGHGVFTWALLEGLRGAADANRDRVVTAGELFDYVSSRVRKETNARQNPRALSGTNKDFPLAGKDPQPDLTCSQAFCGCVGPVVTPEVFQFS